MMISRREGSWGHIGPGRTASPIPVKAGTGCGGPKRLAMAYGTPRNAHKRPIREPSSRPCATSTTGCAAACSAFAAMDYIPGPPVVIAASKALIPALPTKSRRVIEQFQSLFTLKLRFHGRCRLLPDEDCQCITSKRLISRLRLVLDDCSQLFIKRHIPRPSAKIAAVAARSESQLYQNICLSR